MSADRPATRLATRLAFFVAGFGIACWAPLVPFAKARLQIDDAMLGLLLLCIGGGSVAAMLATGPLTARFGSRPVIVASGFLLAAILPFLAIAETPLALGAVLLIFGGALGSLDVAVNVHAVEVERASGVPLMSGFHALFSIGGFAGAGLMTLFLSLEVDTLAATSICAALMLAAMLAARPRLLAARGAEDGPLFVRPQGIVLLLSILAMVTFLAEGAMLDWSALLITQGGLVDVKQGGVGYILFAIAMTAGRLLGDGLVARIGDYRTLLGGGVVAVLGFAVLLAVPLAPVALGGFVLIGLGASNLVPVLFRRAGSQSNMPPALAIGALTTLGYAGILVGPAGIGVVAKAVGLPAAFWILAALLLLVPLTARRVTRGT
ncbi:MFS transporter [Sphingopyxis sp.]|uniref:MFS transporter n=1 Tax=Sphingopyxis sp. TaxID=1908224 RepID=UPI002E0219C2|nr:MFS transporter [Sphingopyxis sp.]